MKAINLKNAMSILEQIDAATRDRAYWLRTKDERRVDALTARIGELQTALVADPGYVALTAELSLVQKRCSSRVIDADKALSVLRDVQEKLGISKKALDGVVVRADPNAQSFPNAYRGQPESTNFVAVYKAGSWRVTEIFRGYVQAPSNAVRVEHTDASRAALLDRFSRFPL